MLTPIRRAHIFRSSRFADQFMAEMQQAYARDFDPARKKEAAVLKSAYDHLLAFQPLADPINGACVLAYPAKTKMEYAEIFPLRLKDLLTGLGITAVFLMDFPRYSLLKDFPFESFHKRNRFKRLGGLKNASLGYLLPVKDLPAVLPLFFFSGRYDTPVIFLLTAEGEVPLSLRLCDDGNLHLNFQEAFTRRIHGAASDAGLVTGDYRLCDTYSLAYLKRHSRPEPLA